MQLLCAVTCPHPWHGTGAPKRTSAPPVPSCPSSVPPGTRAASTTVTAHAPRPRLRHRHPVPGLSVAAADMRALPFADASFDAVVCADDALPHLPTARDVRAALAETLRVLRAGGPLLLSSCGTGTPTGSATAWSSSRSCRPATPGRPGPPAPRTGRSRRSGPRSSPGRRACATPCGTHRRTPASTGRSSPPGAPARLDRMTRGPVRCWTLWSPRRAGGPH
ncbi:class I SAM-dependent methyltransferase [Streptomyces virginiae]|uniref:class I SAM-dependent methyltransferase n=1 Tax=Streptomyces virginiae TaxID=1961 RepID=UPI003681F12C